MPFKRVAYNFEEWIIVLDSFIQTNKEVVQTHFQREYQTKKVQMVQLLQNNC